VSRSLSIQSDLSPLELSVVAVLQQDGRRSYAQMARELDTSEKTVRQTVLKLQDAGVIEITAVTFPPLLGYSGMGAVGLQVDTSRELREVAADLAKIAAIDYVAVTSGRYNIFVDVVCRDKTALLRCLDEDIRTVPGVQHSEVFLYLSLYYQANRGILSLEPPRDRTRHEVSLTDIDREIIVALGDNGRESYQAIATNLDISEAQVRQRVKRLTESGAVGIIAIANPATLGFETTAWVGIRTAGGANTEASRMLAGMPSTSYVAVTAGRFDIFAELVCINERELLDELERIAASEHVLSLEPFIYLELHYKRLTLP
jgi:DNA-binding Lrp family transcriptional regulator